MKWIELLFLREKRKEGDADFAEDIVEIKIFDKK
jgi:hypothetical protein